MIWFKILGWVLAFVMLGMLIGFKSAMKIAEKHMRGTSDVMSRAQREIEKLRAENTKLAVREGMMRRLLAIAVHRLGGEMQLGRNELFTSWDLGLDSAEMPKVVTAFPVLPDVEDLKEQLDEQEDAG